MLRKTCSIMQNILTFILNIGIFYIILLVPHNALLNTNNVMECIFNPFKLGKMFSIGLLLNHLYLRSITRLAMVFRANQVQC
jgi:hypothetical protein